MELGLKRRVNSNSSEVDEKKLGHRLQVRAGGNSAVLTGRKKLTHRTKNVQRQLPISTTHFSLPSCNLNSELSSF